MYDVIIIGAGVSGAAAARELSRYKGRIRSFRSGSGERAFKISAENLRSGARRGCMLWNFQGKQRNRSFRL